MANTSINPSKKPIDVRSIASERKQAIIEKFDQLTPTAKEFVLVCVGAIADKDTRPLEQLRGIHAGDSELVSLIDEAIQHVERKQAGVKS